MRRFVLGALVIAMVLAMTPATAGAKGGNNGKAGPKHTPNDYEVELDDEFIALPGATAYQGVLANAAYKIEVPDAWNGILVMWAHGYRGTGPTLTTDDHPLRSFLISEGYAWAASSYAKNDYNVGQGVLDTHRLAKHVGSVVGEQPDQTFITGASMGGHITAVSIEKYPQTYAGAMPICGVLADVELFDFFADFNVAAQELGESAQEGFPVDDPLRYLGVDVPTIKANLEDPDLGGWPIGLDEDGQHLRALTELRSGGERPNFDQAWLFWNGAFPEPTPQDFLFELAIDTETIPVNGDLVDNSDVVYQFDTDPALTSQEEAFNEEVLRLERDPQSIASRGIAGLPRVTGDIDRPVLTLHNLGDLFVPFHMETIYAERVDDHGKSDLLVQRAIRGVGHCDFTGIELATAFSQLVAWVNLGIKPEGDDVSDPVAVASPDFGCRFTDFSGIAGTHVLPEPCP